MPQGIDIQEMEEQVEGNDGNLEKLQDSITQAKRSQQSAGKLKAVSWNVNGLGEKIKRGVTFQYLKRLKPDIVLLQERHMLGNSIHALDRGGLKMMAHAGYTTGSRGVGIMIRGSMAMKINRTWTDPGGKYVAISGEWQGEILNLVSVYIPPRLQNIVLPEISALLLQMPEGMLLMGGDFNAVIDGEQDRWPQKKLGQDKHQLAGFIGSLGLLDVWRARNPNVIQYTFYSGAHEV